MEQDQKRRIIHVDMDAFFASVEQRDRPELAGRPLLVGGISKRGVVAAASYEARPFGVRSAMPMVEALRRCPHAVVVPPRMRRYVAVSSGVFQIFHRFTPLVEGLSLDEAFLDVTGSQSLFGDAATIARTIKTQIATELSLHASAGVAPCKFVAKIASDLEKPDGLVVVLTEIPSFLAPLPIERMWGIGPTAASRLRASGIQTLGDLAAGRPDALRAVLGSWSKTAQLLARGVDDRAVEVGGAAKSIGAEETFECDIADEAALLRRLLAQSSRIARRLYGRSLYGRVVTVKVKLPTFQIRTARVSMAEPVADTDAIFAAAKAAFRRLGLVGQPLRLIGVSVGQLTAGPIQRSLFEDKLQARREKLEAVSGAIRERFGDKSLTRAALLEDEDA